MCAIVGWQLREPHAVARRHLAEMAALLQHRGPDDSGEYSDEPAGVALAHRRLAIIDLTPDSHQPMVDAQRGVVLAYNGELYNFRQLRDQLLARGHVFH